MADQQPTFQQAMEITATWLQQWDQEEISDEVLADRYDLSRQGTVA